MPQGGNHKEHYYTDNSLSRDTKNHTHSQIESTAYFDILHQKICHYEISWTIIIIGGKAYDSRNYGTVISKQIDFLSFLI